MTDKLLTEEEIATLKTRIAEYEELLLRCYAVLVIAWGGSDKEHPHIAELMRKVGRSLGLPATE